jgi:hypothetical protein
MKYDKAFSFDEEEDALDYIKNAKNSDKINYIEMQKVAKYYRNNLKYSRNKTEKELIFLCKQINNEFNPIVERDSIKKWLDSSEKYNLRIIKSIIITKKEIEVIKTVKNLKNRKLLFSTLVLAKGLKYSSLSKIKGESTSDKFFINYNNLLDVGKLAGIKITEVQTANIFHEFYKADLIKLYSPERESIMIAFAEEAGELALEITDFSNIMKYYEKYFGNDIFQCSDCGIEIIKKSNRQTRCEECSKIIRKEKNTNRMRQKRVVRI